MKNYQKSCFFWYVLPIIEWNIQARQFCKSAKHTSLTAESDPMFYFLSLDLLMVFYEQLTKKKQEYGIILWEFIK